MELHRGERGELGLKYRVRTNHQRGYFGEPFVICKECYDAGHSRLTDSVDNLSRVLRSRFGKRIVDDYTLRIVS